MVLFFEYLFIRLFGYQALDYLNHPNPVVRILLPKMTYPPEQRLLVLRKAYQGAYELLKPALRDKYFDFIDTYAETKETERKEVIAQLTEEKETAMSRYWRDLTENNKKEGRKEEAVTITSLLLTTKFRLSKEALEPKLRRLTNENLHNLVKEQLNFKTSEAVEQWINHRLPKEESPIV